MAGVRMPPRLPKSNSPTALHPYRISFFRVLQCTYTIPGYPYRLLPVY